MKYMLMFCASAEGAEEWEAQPEAVRNEGYAKLGQWFGSNADKIDFNYQLQPPNSAHTVRFQEGGPVVTDGPFIEAKEVIGGFAIVDVADTAAALELAKTWPAQGTVEVRPVIER